jgi:hypothetical protein
VLCRYRAQLVEWLVGVYDSVPANQDVSKIVPDMVQAVQCCCLAWQSVTAECVQNCWRHAGITDAESPAKPPKRATKAAQRRQSLQTFVTVDADAAAAVESISSELDDEDSQDAGAEDAGETDQHRDHASDIIDRNSESPAPAISQRSQLGVLAADVQRLEIAVQELLSNMSFDQRKSFDPMLGAELLEMYDSEERADILEHLTDEEIVQLVLSHNADGDVNDVNADETTITKERAITSLASAQTTIQDLIDFFGAGHESVSKHDGMQYMKLLTDMMSSLSRARQKSMKQTELHAYLAS